MARRQLRRQPALGPVIDVPDITIGHRATMFLALTIGACVGAAIITTAIYYVAAMTDIELRKYQQCWTMEERKLFLHELLPLLDDDTRTQLASNVSSIAARLRAPLPSTKERLLVFNYAVATDDAELLELSRRDRIL